MKRKLKSVKKASADKKKKARRSGGAGKAVRRSRKQTDQPAELQFRERRFGDIPFVERLPASEIKKYGDTLPLPFGGEVKKDAMREHGLIH